MKKTSLLILVFTTWFPGTLAAAQPSPDKIRSYEKHALSHAGDSQRGKQLFSDQRTRCNICHTIENEGGDIGPDLSTIGGKFDRPHLIESLLHPSQQIVEGYRSSVVALDSGKFLSGIIKDPSEDAFVLIDANANRQTIVRDSVADLKTSQLSLMPDDLAVALDQEEFTDLIAYLETLRSGKEEFGSGVRGPLKVAEGFAVETVVTGLTGRHGDGDFAGRPHPVV